MENDGQEPCRRDNACLTVRPSKPPRGFRDAAGRMARFLREAAPAQAAGRYTEPNVKTRCRESEIAALAPGIVAVRLQSERRSRRTLALRVRGPYDQRTRFDREQRTDWTLT